MSVTTNNGWHQHAGYSLWVCIKFLQEIMIVGAHKFAVHIIRPQMALPPWQHFTPCLGKKLKCLGQILILPGLMNYFGYS